MNNKKRIYLFLFSVSLLLFPSFIFSVPAPAVPAPAVGFPAAGNNINILVTWFTVNLPTFLSTLLITAGVIGIIISGFNFITSGGDSGKITSARNWLIYSLVGVIVGTSALAFINWATGGFTGGIGTTINSALDNIAIWLAGLLVTAGVIGIIVSGFNFITSGGDSGKITSARNWLIYSLIGVIVGTSALGFINWATGGFVGGIGSALNIALDNIAIWLSGLLITAGVIGVVVSGFNFVTSGGDSGKITSARNWLIYSLVGVIVGSSALALILWATGGFIGGIGVNLANALLNIANWLFSFLLVAGVIGIVVSGYAFVTSQGDSGKITSARNWLIYSLVGVFVGAVSRVLIAWAVNYFN